MGQKARSGEEEGLAGVVASRESSLGAPCDSQGMGVASSGSPSSSRLMTRRSFLRIAGLAAVSGMAVLSGCGGSAQAASPASASGQASGTPADAGKVVRVGSPVSSAKGGQAALLDLAAIPQKEGYFDEELGKLGYGVAYQGFSQAGPAVNEALASGALDFAVYGDMPVITALAKGIDLTIIANDELAFPQGIVSKNSVASVADLKGKKVAVGIGTAVYQYFIGELQQAGLAANDVEIVNTMSDGPSLLASGNVDAFVTSLGRCVYYVQQNQGCKVLETYANDPSANVFLLAGRTEFVKQSPDVATALVKALQRGFEFAKQNPDKARADLSSEYYPSEDIAREVFSDDTFASLDPNPNDTFLSNLEKTKRFMQDNGYLSGDVDLAAHIDGQYYERALQG